MPVRQHAARVRRARELRAGVQLLLTDVGAGDVTADAVGRIEDVLARGYGHALELDARRRQLDRRIDALGAGSDVAAAELGRLRRERRALERGAADLRGCLNELREHFTAMGGTRLDRG